MNWLEETRFELKKDLQAAAEAARTSGELSFEQLPDFVIERRGIRPTAILPPIWQCCWPGRPKWLRAKLPS